VIPNAAFNCSIELNDSGGMMFRELICVTLVLALLAATSVVSGRAESEGETQSGLAARVKGDVAKLGLGEKA